MLVFHVGAGYTNYSSRGTFPSPITQTLWRTLAVPHWLLALAFCLTPILWLNRVARSWRMRCRTSQGRCPTCGYDLRATPERCPECGMAVPPAQPQPRKAGNA